MSAQEQEQDRGGEPRHPIRVVARRTGVSLHVLRAWERRYGVVSPQRTPGGQRLYSDADIARLKLLRQAVEAGRGISQVAGLGDEELAALAAQDRAGEAVEAAEQPEGVEAEAARTVAACLEAAARLDGETVYRLLMRAVVSLRPRDFVESVIGPLLVQVGERWHRGELSPAHEHATSIAVRRVLGFLLSACEPRSGAPVLLATTLGGDPHEFGAMLASVLAADAGWRVQYLGPSLPAEEIARAAKLSDAAAVAISVVEQVPEERVVPELRALRAGLAPGVRLLIGGRGADAHVAALARIGGVEAGGLALLARGFAGSATAGAAT